MKQTMTALGYEFDASTVDPNTTLPALPAGWYNFRITDAEIKPAKKEGNWFIEVTLKVVDGQFVDRIVTDRVNLWNDNTVAVEIAQKTLSQICRATAIMKVSDVRVLVGQVLQARLSVKPADGTYDESNDVKGYRSLADGQAGGAAAPSGVPPAAPAGPSTPAGPPAAPAGPSTPAGPPAAPAGPPATAPEQPAANPNQAPPAAPETGGSTPPWNAATPPAGGTSFPGPTTPGTPASPPWAQ